MTLTDIIVKILLFFGVFYGGIFIASFVGKKIRQKAQSEKTQSKVKKD